MSFWRKILGARVASVPADGVIARAGSYVLTDNRARSGKINIRITANNVDLDLNGYTLSYTGPMSPSYGVRATDVSNVTIRRGRIIGSQFGILAPGARNLTVEDVDFTGCLYIGLCTSAASSGLHVRRCVFAEITGWSREAYAIGINGIGDNAVIEQCRFHELYRQPTASGVGEGCAVLLSAGSNGVIVRNNWFENSEVRGEKDIGVWVAHGASAHVTQNTFTNFGRGVIATNTATVVNNRLVMKEQEDGSNGIHAPSGAVTHNILAGYDTPISGDASQSGNKVLP